MRARNFTGINRAPQGENFLRSTHILHRRKARHQCCPRIYGRVIGDIAAFTGDRFQARGWAPFAAQVNVTVNHAGHDEFLGQVDHDAFTIIAAFNIAVDNIFDHAVGEDQGLLGFRCLSRLIQKNARVNICMRPVMGRCCRAKQSSECYCC